MATRPPRSTQSPTQQARELAEQLTYEKGLPGDVDSERFVLGSILLDDSCFEAIAENVEQDDFSLEKHRRIFARMKDLRARGEHIDRVTLANELIKQGQLESVDGLAYLVSLDEGLPDIAHPESYSRIVKEKSNLRRMIFAGQSMINRALSGEEESTQIAASTIETFQRIEGVRAEDGGKTPLQIVESFAGGISEFMDPSLRKRGLPTGFTKFDELTAGFHGGQLIIVAARPSMGKTAWALNVISHLCLHPQQRRSAGVFSLEMAASELITRMLCSTSRVDAHKFRAGYLNADERKRLREGLERIIECRLKIFDSYFMMHAIEKAARRGVKEEGWQLVVVDYLQLVGGYGKSENRNQEVTAISRGFKLLAKELDIPFLVLSQLNRANEKRPGDRKPILSDIRESGAVEQDADVVAFIHREELYKRNDESLRGFADLILAKQRNGPIGTVPLRFLGQYVRFENRAEDLYDDALPEE